MCIVATEPKLVAVFKGKTPLNLLHTTGSAPNCRQAVVN